MFKTSSTNEQGRLDRITNFGRVNDHGIDPGVYATQLDQERTRLVQEKRETEHRLFEVKRSIAEAVARVKGFKSGSRIPDAVFGRWRADAKKLTERLLVLEGQLGELKIYRRKSAESFDAEKDKRFERVFMRTAKELLAGPVYDRIVTATLHRLSLENDEKAFRDAG